MEIRDLYASQLQSLAPLAVGDSTLEELTDSCLTKWAVEICEDVFEKVGDPAHLIK